MKTKLRKAKAKLFSTQTKLKKAKPTVFRLQPGLDSRKAKVWAMNAFSGPGLVQRNLDLLPLKLLMKTTGKPKMRNNQFLKEMGARIRAIRKAKDIRLRTLSKMCQLDEGALSRIELGKNSSRVLTLVVIADHLGVDVKDFF